MSYTNKVYIIGNHGIQHGGCKTRRMNPKAYERHVSPNAGWRSLICQWLLLNSSVWKLLLFIYKGGNQKITKGQVIFPKTIRPVLCSKGQILFDFFPFFDLSVSNIQVSVISPGGVFVEGLNTHFSGPACQWREPPKCDLSVLHFLLLDSFHFANNFLFIISFSFCIAFPFMAQ